MLTSAFFLEKEGKDISLVFLEFTIAYTKANTFIKILKLNGNIFLYVINKITETVLSASLTDFLWFS